MAMKPLGGQICRSLPSTQRKSYGELRRWIIYHWAGLSGMIQSSEKTFSRDQNKITKIWCGIAADSAFERKPALLLMRGDIGSREENAPKGRLASALIRSEPIPVQDSAGRSGYRDGQISRHGSFRHVDHIAEQPPSLTVKSLQPGLFHRAQIGPPTTTKPPFQFEGNGGSGITSKKCPPPDRRSTVYRKGDTHRIPYLWYIAGWTGASGAHRR